MKHSLTIISSVFLCDVFDLHLFLRIILTGIIVCGSNGAHTHDFPQSLQLLLQLNDRGQLVIPLVSIQVDYGEESHRLAKEG